MKKASLIESLKPVRSIIRILNFSIFGIGLGILIGSLLIVVPKGSNDQNKLQNNNLTKNWKYKNQRFKKQYNPTSEITLLSKNWEKLIRLEGDLKASAYLILENGDYAAINHKVEMPAASMIKVPILFLILEMLDRGDLLWNEKIKLNRESLASGSGWIRYQEIGKEFPVYELVTEMIRVSDNTATNLLIQRIGGIQKVNDRLRKIGLKQTQIKNFLPDLQGTNTTTSEEITKIIVLADSINALSPKARDLFREIMGTSVTNRLIPDGLLKGLGKAQGNSDYRLLIEGFKVYNKTGDIGIAYGDSALIQMPDASRAVLGLIVQGPFNDPRSPELIRKMAAATIPSIQATEKQ